MQYNLSQKRDPQAWLASRNGGKGPSAATAAMFKAEAEGRIGNPVVASEGQSLGPGGRKLKAVDSGMNGLFDDEDDGAQRRREKELGEEGDVDEQVYEEDFADDEEKMDVDEHDEEAKELEERLKREYKTANKQRDTGVDDSDEKEEPTKSKQAKAMQKMIRNREGNEVYESDEEENPYASSAEEEEEEDELPVPTGPAIQEQQVDSKLNTPKPQPNRPNAISKPGSRATSPSNSPGLGGHTMVAKRATSPKVPKPKPVGSATGGNSPLGSRANSPVAGSRATSPARLDSINGNQKKRKADDSSNSTLASLNTVPPPKPKKRKGHTAGTVPVAVSPAELEMMLVEWLKNAPNATTRDCIQHFTPYLTDGDKKTGFSAMVRKVAQLKGGVLTLRTIT